MSQTTATHSLAPLVTRLVDAAELEPEAAALRDPAAGPKEYISALAKAGQHADALKFLAHLLPRREAVWWAWMCARKEAGQNAEPEIVVALKATEEWIGEPTDQNRRAAMQAAEGASFETAAGCAALAAFLSGGSLAPPDVSEVAPPRFAAARAVFGSLILAAVTVQPERSPERFRRYLGYGLELAERIRLWESLERKG
jgi:hypothetical protein